MTQVFSKGFMSQKDTFPSYSVILLQFIEISSNLAAAQAAKATLRLLSPVAPFTSLLDSQTHP